MQLTLNAEFLVSRSLDGGIFCPYPNPMFQLFDHTADLGLRVEAATLEELFAEAARGITSMLIEHPESLQPTLERQVHLSGDELEYLFLDWLSELLFAFDSEHWLGAEFDVHLDSGLLSVAIRGETFDAVRHEYGHEVKAITYHGLTVEQTPDGRWFAEVIVDI